MEGLENTTVTAADQLATLYSPPSERVLRKEIDCQDQNTFMFHQAIMVLFGSGAYGAAENG